MPPPGSVPPFTAVIEDDARLVEAETEPVDALLLPGRREGEAPGNTKADDADGSASSASRKRAENFMTIFLSLIHI